MAVAAWPQKQRCELFSYIGIGATVILAVLSQVPSPGALNNSWGLPRLGLTEKSSPLSALPYPCNYSSNAISLDVSSFYQWVTSSGNSTIGFLTQTLVDSRIAVMWSSIEQNPTFGQLVTRWGANNCTYSLNDNLTVGITNATYGVSWNQSGVGFTEYWVGDIGSEHTTGPFTAMMQPRPQPTPSGYFSRTNVTDINYAGYALNNSQQGTFPLASASGSTTMGTMLSPRATYQLLNCSRGCSGVSVDPEASEWVGVTNYIAGQLGAPSGQSRGLLQTGWDTDLFDASDFNYTFWYEFFPWENSYKYPNSPSGAPGFNVGLSVWNEENDYTYNATLARWCTSFHALLIRSMHGLPNIDFGAQHCEDDSTNTHYYYWHPTWTLYILETPARGTLTMQVPELSSSTIHFGGHVYLASFTPSRGWIGANHSLDDLYSGGANASEIYNFTLNQYEPQYGPLDSTKQSWQTSGASNWQAGPDITWLHSYYDCDDMGC